MEDFVVHRVVDDSHRLLGLVAQKPIHFETPSGLEYARARKLFVDLRQVSTRRVSRFCQTADGPETKRDKTLHPAALDTICVGDVTSGCKFIQKESLCIYPILLSGDIQFSGTM